MVGTGKGGRAGPYNRAEEARMLRVRRKMERERVTIEFGGPTEEVGVGAFAATLFAYATVVQEAARIINPRVTVDVNVRAVRPGCVSVDVDVVAGLIDALRNVVGCIAPIAPDVVATAAEFYRFRRDVARGGGVREMRQIGNGSVVVTTGNGSNVTISCNTYNLYVNSPKAGKAVGDTFSSLEGDEAVESLSIGAAAPGEVLVGRDDFGPIAASPVGEGERTREAVETAATLSVVKTNFVMSADRKWGFVNSAGTSISASIADKGFLDALPSLSFTMGTVMVVDIKKVQSFDRRLNMFIDKPDSYVITKVHDVIPPNVTPEIPGFGEAQAEGE